jgi:ribosomal protein RSM22 (predicted rRNA methylase)
MLDANAGFLGAARSLAAVSEHPALRTAEFVHGDAAQFAPGQRYDLIVASYVLAELAVSRAAEMAARLWAACDGALLIVEPGTPEGFARIRAARAGLIESGARIGAPCIGEYACPISGDDWCHFAVRLPRSRDHMRAKSAEVPFEDEKFSYVAAVREAIALAPVAARVLARPHRTKVAIRMKLCTPSGVEDRIVPARDRATFKTMRKKDWGDAF